MISSCISIVRRCNIVIVSSIFCCDAYTQGVFQGVCTSIVGREKRSPATVSSWLAVWCTMSTPQRGSSVVLCNMGMCMTSESLLPLRNASITSRWRMWWPHCSSNVRPSAAVVRSSNAHPSDCCHPLVWCCHPAQCQPPGQAALPFVGQACHSASIGGRLGQFCSFSFSTLLIQLAGVQHPLSVYSASPARSSSSPCGRLDVLTDQLSHWPRPALFTINIDLLRPSHCLSSCVCPYLDDLASDLRFTLRRVSLPLGLLPLGLYVLH